MGATDRYTLPIPYGQHVYVVSDLSLSPTTNPAARPVRELIALLEDIDDSAVVVVAGNLLHPEPDDHIADFLAATLRALPALAVALRSFSEKSGHRFIVLPGADDAALAEAGAAAPLEALGVELAHDVMAQVATANDVRDVGIVAGYDVVDVSPAYRGDRADADRLEDPNALARFVASRTLYRRLGVWVWIPVLVLAVIDLWSTLTSIANRITDRHLHFELHLKIHAHHPTGFWGNTVTTVLVLGLVEALAGAVAGLLVRRRFDHDARSTVPHLFEPLARTFVDDVDALEYARRVAEHGGAGAVVGGSSRPALAFLDRGVCATPGPSRTVIVERHGLLGLPPVFTSVDRLGIVEVEAASTVQVRLYTGQSPLRRGTLLERVVAGSPVQPELSLDTAMVGAWPTGNPYPASVDGLSAQRRQRAIRRLVSGIIFLDGLVNLVVTAVAPLRSRLLAVETYLPLGVAKSAAALTALAGILMIMVARGLRRGQRRAWTVTVVVVAATSIAHLIRAGSLVSPLLAVAILTLLLVERPHFLATTDRTTARAALPRLVLIGIVVVLAASLGLEASSGRHHLPGFFTVVLACAERLIGITTIPVPDRIGDFINPTLTTVGVALLVSALYLVTRPVVDRRLSSTTSTRERRLAELRAREIVRRHGRGTLDYFALRDDKQFYFFRDSLIAYAVYGGVALVSPDPIGPEAERPEAFSAFRAFAESRGWTIAVMGAGAEWLSIYHAAGLHSLYIGDEAIVDCQTFSLEGGKMKGLRQACTRLARKGYTVEFLDPSTIDPARVPALVDLISMLRRGEGERGFSMMLGRLFDPKDKGLLLTVVTSPDGQPAAVCQFVPSPAINGYSLDLMRRDPGEHPNGLIDYALCSTVEHLRGRGARGLSLNFAAFRSVLDGERGEGTFTRVERWALKRLSGVLPIESLWQFNAKYYPAWLPRYLVYPAAESFVPVVAATFRAESLTEIPVLGRFLTHDPANRPGTVVPEEVLEAAARTKRHP